MCKVTGIVLLIVVLCGLVSSSLSMSLNGADRSKRLASDQRMAELQALVSLARGGGYGGSIGHGMFDAYGIGKRSGAHRVQSVESGVSNETDEKQVLRRVIAALAAEQDAM